jgi:hypothetical protein
MELYLLPHTHGNETSYLNLTVINTNVNIAAYEHIQES